MWSASSLWRQTPWTGQEEVYRYLPAGKNGKEYCGSQILIDAAGMENDRETRLLLGSTNLEVEEVVRRVNGRGGLCLSAHVDRLSYSLLANLGLVPPGLPVSALELGLLNPGAAREKFPAMAGWPLVAFRCPLLR